MSSVFSAAAQPVSLLAMLFSGLLAFVSPCVLPMLPVYAAYLMDGDGGKPSAPIAIGSIWTLCEPLAFR